ncbi:MAG: hypothetical protein ACXW3M_12870 [Rhodoplanes sp.]
MRYGDKSDALLAWTGKIAHDLAIRFRSVREMALSRQRDLFLDEEQADLFGEDAPTPVYRADPDEVRAELYKILAEARAAQKLPWEPRRVALYRTIFPQMTNWLPRDEAAAIVLRIRDGIGAPGGRLITRFRCAGVVGTKRSSSAGCFGWVAC